MFSWVAMAEGPISDPRETGFGRFQGADAASRDQIEPSAACMNQYIGLGALSLERRALVPPFSRLGRQGIRPILVDFFSGLAWESRARRTPREIDATTATTLLVLMSLLVGIAVSNQVLTGSRSLTTAREVAVTEAASIDVGAPPGFGLTNPSILENHFPIYIGNNSAFTSDNGVRRGTGAPADPYIISDWVIDGSLYPGAPALIWIESTNAYVVIQNNKIVNLYDANQWEGIQLGHYPEVLSTSHVTIRNNLIVNSGHAYGISVREGSSDVYIGANYVQLDATVDHLFGIEADRGVHDVTIFGNYVNAYTGGTFLTEGIHIGDIHIDDARRGTNVVATRNTVVNATAAGIASLSSTGTRIEANLVYNAYAVPKVVGPDYPRGITTGQNSVETLVVDNQIHSVHWGIQVGADRGRFASNFISDVDTAIYVVDNGTYAGATTFGETIYDTTYSGVASGGIRLPADFRGTVVDLGPGIRAADMSSALLSILGTATQISYTWSGDLLNLSATVGGVVLFDTEVTSETHNLAATWSGSIPTLKVTSLLPGGVTFELLAFGDVAFTGAGFLPSEKYSLTRTAPGSATPVLNTTSSSGNLAFTIPSQPARATFALLAEGVSDPSAPMSKPPVVTGTPGANGWYVSVVSVTLAATSPTGSTVTIAYRIDRGPWFTYTGPLSLGEGNHTLEYRASDAEGHLEAIRSLPLPVDVTNPIITGLAPTGRVTNPTASVSWTASDQVSGIAGYEVRIDNGSFQKIGATPSYSQFWSSRSHTVQVKAVDKAGHESVASTTFTVEPEFFGSGGLLQILPAALPVVALALLVASYVLLRSRRPDEPANAFLPPVEYETILPAELEEAAAESDELNPDDVGVYEFRPEDYRRDNHHDNNREDHREDHRPEDDRPSDYRLHLHGYPRDDSLPRGLRYDDSRPDDWRD
ncbi:MAG: hypothetical protein E6K19_04560 [Methanobacteriota archaeon]|nr:MAG: hypothetical protein E6K19_04560 [Euryarchaeota archaeon]